MFNQSFVTGIIPDELKVVLATQVLKASIMQLFTNLPNQSLFFFAEVIKIMEKIMHKRLVKCLDRHSIIFQSQYGFRKKQTNKLNKFKHHRASDQIQVWNNLQVVY